MGAPRLLLSPPPGLEPGGSSLARESDTGAMHEGHLLVAKPDVHTKVTCPRKHTPALLFSHLRDRMRSLYFQSQQGPLPTLPKVLDSECHQLEGEGIKRSLFDMCNFPLDTPGWGQSPSGIQDWPFTQTLPEPLSLPPEHVSAKAQCTVRIPD